MITNMRIHRWKHWTMEVVLWILLATFGNVLLVEGRRPSVHGGDSSDDARPPIDIPTNEGAVHGYRGSAGTLGVLTAAAFVIPAGVIAVLYLLYVSFCGQREDDLDKHVSGGSRECSVFGQKGVIVANGSWPNLDDLVVDAKQEEMFTSMSEKTEDLKPDRSELVSLMSSVECDVTTHCDGDTTPCDRDTVPCDGDTTPCDGDTTPCDRDTTSCDRDTTPCDCDTTPCDRNTTTCDHDTTPCDLFTANGSIMDLIIPDVEWSVQSSGVNHADPISVNPPNGNPLKANHADPPTEDQDFQNTVEIFVTGDDVSDSETIPCDNASNSSGSSSSTTNHNTTTTDQPPPTSFKPAVKPPVVNEVHVNLRFADLPTVELDANEKYVSEVMLFLPGAQTDAE